MRQQSSPVRRYQIEVVAKAIDVLEALAGHPQGLSLSEMAARVRLPRSTVHRLVCTLQVKGLLVQATEHGRYALGLRLFQLGKEAEPQLAKAALPLMKELAAKFKETVSLGILEEGRLGDVVVLTGDYFRVPDARLRTLSSELTVLGGTVVHSGPVRYCA